jgi:hypothetical protein
LAPPTVTKEVAACVKIKTKFLPPDDPGAEAPDNDQLVYEMEQVTGEDGMPLLAVHFALPDDVTRSEDMQVSLDHATNVWSSGRWTRLAPSRSAAGPVCLSQ